MKKQNGECTWLLIGLWWDFLLLLIFSVWKYTSDDNKIWWNELNYMIKIMLWLIFNAIIDIGNISESILFREWFFYFRICASTINWYDINWYESIDMWPSLACEQTKWLNFLSKRKRFSIKIISFTTNIDKFICN